MRDHYLFTDDGQRVAVTDLPTAAIYDLLREGVCDAHGVTEADFLERLRIELVARGLKDTP